jgi:hypothetical protein
LLLTSGTPLFESLSTFGWGLLDGGGIGFVGGGNGEDWIGFVGGGNGEDWIGFVGGGNGEDWIGFVGGGNGEDWIGFVYRRWWG